MEYEAHMSLPYVLQAQFLAERLGSSVEYFQPGSVGVLGASGGNGFEVFQKYPGTDVCAVDINPVYLRELKRRYSGKIPRLSMCACDLSSEIWPLPQFGLLYAALILEYLPLVPSMRNLSRHLATEGRLFVIVQMASEVPEVTPSPYQSLGSLAHAMRLVDPVELFSIATSVGLAIESKQVHQPAGDKRFLEVIFRRG